MHGVLLVILGFSAVSTYGRYSIAVEMAARQEAAERELAELEARQATLTEQVEYITSERGIEAEMRRQFDVVREGEQVVIIVDERTEQAP